MENISSNRYFKDSIVKKNVYNDYLKIIESFKNNKDCFIIKYEDIIEDPAKIILNIDLFLKLKSNCYILPKYRLDFSGGRGFTDEYFTPDLK